MSKLLIGLLLALMLLPASAWSTNTDFEGTFQANGVAADWTAYTYGAPDAVYSEENTIIHGGLKAQKVDTSTGGECGIYIQQDTTAGKIYDVSVWVYHVSGAQAYLGVDVNAGTDPGAAMPWANNTASGTWQQLSVRVTATGPKVSVFCDSWASVVYFDNVTITEVVPVTAQDDFGPVPYEIWAEGVYWQQALGDTGPGNAIGHGQVLIDGNKSIIAEGQGGVLVYGDEKINGTAFVKSTPHLAYFFDPAAPGWPATSNYSTKAATLLNGVLYSQDMHMRIHKATPWEGAWDEPGTETGRVESDCTGLVTDGTYLYGSDNPDPFDAKDNCSSKIYKWSVNPTTGAISNALGWPITIPAPHSWLISIGYYGGKLYAAEGFNGRNIFEIDCDDGEYRTLLSGDNLIPEACKVDSWYMGQIARCGNTIVLAGWSGHITQWKLIDGVWTKYSSWRWHPIFEAGDFPLRMHTDTPYFLGLSLKPGPDGNAKYAWTSAANVVSFWDLDPTYVPGSLGDARKSKNGYPVIAQNAVVTKTGSGEFWVEDKDRASASRVAWNGAVTVGNTVTLKGSMNTIASGEKVFNAIEVTEGAAADPAIKPVFITNKNMTADGLGTDGMLVTVSGKVTHAVFGGGASDIFFIDDGSGVASEVAGVKGVKVTAPDMMNVMYFMELWNAPVAPFLATVTGIVRIEKLADGTITRRIQAFDNANVVITPLF